MRGVVRTCRWSSCLVLLLVLATGSASAQPVVNPTTVEFTPSADHNRLATDGRPLVDSYSLSLYLVGATIPFETVSLGKPSPGTDGLIRLNFLSLLSSEPAPNITYEARVKAIGPGGENSSAVSNTFTYQISCSFSLGFTSQSFVAAGGSGSVGVATTTGCAWGAASNASWVTVTGGATGSGSGTVTYTVAANTSASQRTGTISIAGQVFTVTQAGLSCSYTINPIAYPATAAGGSGTIAVTSATGCAWTAASNVGWISVTSGASGSGNGSVAFSVAPNTSITQRTGTVTVAGQTFTVTQAGASCAYSLTPTSYWLAAGGGNASFTMTAQPGCSWTATSNTPWVTVTGVSSGTGSGTVTISVAANTSTTQRSGTVTAGGQTFTVLQEGVACAYTLTPTSQSIAAAGASGTVSVTAQAGCTWTATTSTSWITLTTSSGSGNGSVAFTVAANASVSPRTGTIVVEGRTFTITQSGITCTYTLSPASQTMGAGSGSGGIAVSAPAGCAWAASSSASWLVVTGTGTGNGSGAVSFAVSENPVITQRSATITVAGQSATVIQSGASCGYTVSPANVAIASSGGSGTASVSALAGCAWTASSGASWLTITSGASGSGTGSVAFSAPANPAGSQRSATITVAGQTLTVTQAGTTCTYSLSPSSGSTGAAGGSGTVNLSTLAGCAWSATSNSSWISVTSGSTGTGSGTVSFSAAANASSAQRSGTLNIGGQVFTLTQSGISCAYALTPATHSVGASGGSGSFAVSAAATDCSWTAASNAGWLSVTGGTTGVGAGTVTFTAAPNASITQRSGTITAAGQTFTITQAGATCAYSITPSTQWVVAGGGTATFSLAAQAGCTWTASATSPWITVTGGASGSGAGTVTMSVAANTSSEERFGLVTAGGQTFTVMQEGVACSYALSPAGQSVAAGGGSGTVSVSAPGGCGWNAATTVPWVTLNASSGVGTGSVGFTVASNPTVSQRTGAITIEGRTFNITQAGVSCSYSLSPTTHAMGAGSGNGSVAVTAQAGCAWTAASSAGWVAITGSATGDGSGSVTFSVTANPGTTQRSATISIGGQTSTINQAGAACSFSVSPASQSLPSSGGSGSATVSSQNGCAWTASSNSSWLSITSGASGSGPGTAAFTASANTGASQRTAIVTIAGQTITVAQAGSSCSYSLTPVTASMVSGGGLGTITVSTAAGCAWSATSNVPWIAVTGGASGTGVGTAILTVAANTTAAPRVGTVTVAGLTYTLTQAGTGCSYALTPTSQSVPAGGANGSIAMSVQSGCEWNATSNASWLTVTGILTGTGSGTITYSALPNPGASSRTATITAGGRTFTVTQAGASCNYAISPVSQSIVAAGGGGTISMYAPAGCEWTAVSDSWWLEISSGATGSGNGTVGFSVDFNSSISQRTGTIAIGGQTFTVTQVGSTCSYTVTPTSQSLFSSGGNGSVTVSTQMGCAWSAGTAASWITLTGSTSGTGGGTVTFSAAPNTAASQRTATLTVAGQNVTVTQAGFSCGYTLTPTSQWISTAGGGGSFTVSPQAGCSWTASASAGWITITGGASGSAAGTVSYTVAANTEAAQRTGTINVSGRLFTITQPGTSCSYSLTPTSQSIGAAGGLGTITTSTTLACSWMAVSNTPWIAVTGGASGSGVGTTILSIAANTTASIRTGTVSVAGRTFTVTQAAGTCTYTLSTSTATAPAAGGTGSVGITAGTGCSWSATTTASWITVTSTGTGSGTITFTTAPNTTSAARTGTIVAGGRTLTISQAALTPPTTPSNLRIIIR